MSDDYWLRLRQAIEYDEEIGEGICSTAHVAIEMLEAHDRGEL